LRINRRSALQAGATGIVALGASATAFAAPFNPPLGPRARVIYVNDLSGDIDGLFATVHMILSTSVELRGIVGTATFSPYFSDESAVRSAELAHEMLRLMEREGLVPIAVGADQRMPGTEEPVPSAGAEAIVAEAMRDDTELPLFVTVGGGLTEVASALLMKPRIRDRFTLVWIGGDDLPEGGTGETNFGIDAMAARYIYNETEVPIWQVSRRAYSTCTVTASEIEAFVRPCGAIGAWLSERLFDMATKSQGRLNTGETWNLGDNPLVLLTALTDWVPSGGGGAQHFVYQGTSSSHYEEVVAPLLNTDGTFSLRESGRIIRIYDAVDTRTMHADMFAKLRINFPPQ